MSILVIKSMIAAQPGLKVQICMEIEKGSSDTREKFYEFELRGFAVVSDDPNDSDRIEPMFIDGDGAPVVFSQYVLSYPEIHKLHESSFQIEDSNGKVAP